MSATLSSHPTLTPNINTTLRPNATPAPSLSLARTLSDSPTTLASLTPYALFLTQLHTHSAETRVDAMRRLFVVANAMGRDETLLKLIPTLTHHIRDSADGSNIMSHAAAVPTGQEEDDEILLIMAEQLGQMVECGLIPGYRALVILPILEQLAGVEETVVREKAVESLNLILPLLKAEGVSVKGKEEEEARQSCVRLGPGLILNMVKRMAGADWFTAKVSACAVLPAIYQFFNCMKSNATVHIGVGVYSPDAEDGAGDGDKGNQGGGVSVQEVKAELRNMYRLLTEDETPMVRRGTAKSLARFVEAVAKLPYGIKGPNGGPITKEFMIGSMHTGNNGGKDEAMIKKTVSQDLKNKVYEEIVPLYQALSTDEQDSVRLLAVSASGSVGCALGLDAGICSQVVLPIIKAGSADLSWRVRNNLAKEFAIVAQSQGFHDPSRKNDLIAVFTSFASLLQDFEAQVRASAVENIALMAQLGGVDLFQAHISPLLPTLADDPVVEVRSKLAQTIMDCCDGTICSSLTDKVILQDFKPCLENFLNDEFAEVQLNILSKLWRVTRLLDQMDAVVSSVVSMSKNPNWRVRQAVGLLLPHLAEARGVAFFQEQLLDVWMTLLMDQVADVRTACVNGMPKLLSVTGSSWVQREIVPRYVGIYQESISYLSRVTVLRSFSRLAVVENGNGVNGGGNGGHGLSKDLADEIADHLLKGLGDKVVNVRMVSARGLEEMSSSLDHGVWNAQVLPVLEQIVTEDPDDDCKFYAQQAIESFNA